MIFSADHHGCYRADQPFIPSFQENPNTILIRIPALLSDDLNWENEINHAKNFVTDEQYILWDIDFGFKDLIFSPHDTAAFYSFSLAIDEFVKQIYSHFRQKTLGVSLYHGSCFLDQSFSFSQWDAPFKEWLLMTYSHELPKSEQLDEKWIQTSLGKHYYQLFCMQTFAEYLHRLISFLPNEILPFVIFDISQEKSLAKVAQLLSKGRFQHTQIVIKGKTPQCFLPHSGASLGVYFPCDRSIDTSVLACFDELFDQLSRLNLNYRLILEEKMTEEWDHLDQMIVISKTVSLQGMRKLRGFCAAGGVVIHSGPLLNLTEEMSWEEFILRGIQKLGNTKEAPRF